jgi:Xaa-Pro dipeptidase
MLGMMKINPTILPPSEAEIASRLSRVQASLAERGIDYYLCHDPANIFYLTNFANFVHERPFILVVPASGCMSFLVPKLEKNHVEVRAVGPLDLVHYFEFPAPPGQMWDDHLREMTADAALIGLESQCPLSVSQALRADFTVCDVVEDAREIKSSYEIGRLAYCSNLLSLGHARLLEEARPGQLPILLHKEVSGLLMQNLLMDYPGTNVLNTKFNVATQPPPLSDDPHNFTELFSPLVEGGPHVTIVQGLANGYGAELERTFFLGQVPEAAVKPFNDMLDARALAYELLQPGASMAEIDTQVNELLKGRGYADNLLHRTGHSFGVTDHEGPFLAEGYEREVLPNMVFSVEPGIYLPGLGGFRLSDTVLVTDTGNEKLTEAPETLDALTIP